MIELRERDSLDGSGPSVPFPSLPGWDLAQALRHAAASGCAVDVLEDGRYLVTYCAGSPYWWLPGTHGGGMHQIGSHGWCHDCHSCDLGYVHHLDYETELAVLALEARTDRVLGEQCEADGQTPEQYAQEIAGRAVPLDGDRSFVTAVHELGVNAGGLAEFAVDMWDMTTWKVAVPLEPGAPDRAWKIAEEMAVADTPRRCVHCHGRRGHSRRCPVTQQAELLEKYPYLRDVTEGWQ